MKRYLLVLAVVGLAGCIDEGIPVPPDIPIERLLTAPDTISVRGRSLALSTVIWRDFMPVSPPDGQPLVALVYVSAADPAPLPPSLSADALWIVHENQVWKSWLTNEESPDHPPNRIAYVARNGPRWGPGGSVDVIVRILDGGRAMQLLRASNQRIQRTD